MSFRIAKEVDLRGAKFEITKVENKKLYYLKQRQIYPRIKTDIAVMHYMKDAKFKVIRSIYNGEIVGS